MAKKKKSRRGRPAMKPGESRGVLLSVRIQPAEREAIDAAAQRDHLALSEWVRLALKRAAGQDRINQSKDGGSGNSTPST